MHGEGEYSLIIYLFNTFFPITAQSLCQIWLSRKCWEIISYSICEAILKNRYYDSHNETETERNDHSGILVALWLLPFLPLIFIAFVGSVIRSGNNKIHFRLVDPENYSSTAGIVLAGMFLSFFILSCDILAVYYATSGNHEYGEDHVSNSLNILILQSTRQR